VGVLLGQLDLMFAHVGHDVVVGPFPDRLADFYPRARLRIGAETAAIGVPLSLQEQRRVGSCQVIQDVLETEFRAAHRPGLYHRLRRMDRRVMPVLLHEDVSGACPCPSDRFDDPAVHILGERLDSGGAHVAERSDPEDKSGRRLVVRKLGNGDKVINAHRQVEGSHTPAELFSHLARRIESAGRLFDVAQALVGVSHQVDIDRHSFSPYGICRFGADEAGWFHGRLPADHDPSTSDDRDWRLRK